MLLPGFGVRLAQMKMNIVVGGVAGNDQPDRRRLETGRVVPKRAAKVNSITFLTRVANGAFGSVIELQGEQLLSVALGHTDIAMAIWVRHMLVWWRFQAWIAALDKIELLNPVAVIAGHKRPGASDAPNNIEETRKYIRDFDTISINTKTALELYNQMLAIYPVNPAVLWLSARAMKPGT